MVLYHFEDKFVFAIVDDFTDATDSCNSCFGTAFNAKEKKKMDDFMIVRYYLFNE
jgi:hypothetical protein